MIWSDIGALVGKAAPIVGGLLGGPAGAAVGGLVASALGTDSTPDAVAAALQADPQAMARVVEVQTNAKVQLQQLAVTAEQNRLQAANAQYAAEAADRASARDLAARQPKDWVRPLVTILMIAGAAFIIWLVFSGTADSLLRDSTASLIVGSVVGAWFAALNIVMAFWFGTTREAQHAAADIQRFATAPGSVTLDGREPAAHGR